MNKLACIVFALLLITANVYAAADPAPDASASATPTMKLQKIEDLKERLATKVAELRQVQTKAIFGTIKTTSISTMSVETKTNEVKIELTDDIKIYQMIKGERTALTQDDLAKGDVVTIVGEYDASLDLLKAKTIFIQGSFPERINGTVTAVDAKNFTISLTTDQNQPYIVDIERTTVTYTWEEGKGLTKSGFSKIEAGRTIHITGSAVPKKENRISASRIIDLGNVTGTTPTPTKTMEPEASVSASPKPSPKILVTPKSTPTPEP